MRNLTILNPAPLMNFIEEALKKLQQGMGRKFSTKVMSGLYLHISSMVERLVTKKPLIPHAQLDCFQREHAEFIRLFTECFHILTQYYSIDIPLTEIAYCYDYIENGFIVHPSKREENGE